MATYDYLFKFIMIGDSNVGKTCMLTRYVDGWFKADNDPTIGVEFGSKIIKCPDESVIRVQVWDTAGQESFRSITKSYYRGAIGAILVYDVTNKKTFDSLPKWLEDTLNTSKHNICLLLIGNKTDQEQNRVVSFQDGQNFAREHKILFMETSAKDGSNIEKAFECITNIILEKIKRGEIDPKEELGIKEGTLARRKSSEPKPSSGFRCC